MLVSQIFIANDHRGYDMKMAIKHHLEKKYNVKDLGCHNNDSVDAIDYARAAVSAIAGDVRHFAVLICGSGIAMSTAAGRASGIRAGIAYDNDQVSKMRMHNDANILVIGADYTDIDSALQYVDIFFNTEFLGGHYTDRLTKLDTDYHSTISISGDNNI